MRTTLVCSVLVTLLMSAVARAAAGRAAAQLRILQDEGPADAPREAAGPRALRRVPRPGHAAALPAARAGATTWTDEESRKNFDVIKRVAQPGNLKSRLLLHPLEEQAGGDFYHNGGKHFTSQNDPEWQVLKAFVMGQTN